MNLTAESETNWGQRQDERRIIELDVAAVRAELASELMLKVLEPGAKPSKKSAPHTGLCHLWTYLHFNILHTCAQTHSTFC